MIDQMLYLGLPPEQPNWQPSAFIYVGGSAIDHYRNIDILESNLHDIGAALVDVEAANALGKILSGGIDSHKDLEGAETALQAILLHDHVPVFHPAPKILSEDDFLSYVRPRGTELSAAGRSIFELAGGTQWIVCPEYAVVTDGTISGSRLDGSPINGLPHSGKMRTELDIHVDEYLNPSTCESVHSFLDMHRVPAYIANERLSRPCVGDDFSKDFYRRMSGAWATATASTPPIYCSFTLPPLLAIVLDRLNHRDDLKTTLAELRSELSECRKELRTFNSLLDKPLTQAELQRRISRIAASFDAIVPSTRISKEERRLRGLAVVQRLVSPLMKAWVRLLLSSGVSYGEMLKAAGEHGVRFTPNETTSIVNRTVTARTFSRLLENTESLQSLVKHHLSAAELRSVEQSLRRDKTG